MQTRDLKKLESRIRKTRQKERHCEGLWRRWGYRAVRAFETLYHEMLKDEIAVRAQALSYFTLFSILPLIAGVFLFLNFFSQWGPVKSEFQDLLIKLLQPVPDRYRDALVHFIFEFKDVYLAQIAQKSGTIGVFALGVLVWIMAKVFVNVEDALNRVWASDQKRGWFERFQNFIVCAVVIPVSVVVAISLPGLVGYFGGPTIALWLKQGIPLFVELFGMTFLFRSFPNTRVRWKSAFGGAAFATVLWMIADLLLKIYFRFGTETAYGKAAVLPIVAFLIYIFWTIFLMGAEVSYLLQHRGLSRKR